MKKPTLLNLLLITSLLSNVSYAKSPHLDTLNELTEMSNEELIQLLDHKNAKGESVIRKYLKKDGVGNQPNLWSQMDSVLDSTEGTSTTKAYANPQAPKAAKEIIVAVIDGGVDIKHEDLKGKIWVNDAEANGLPGVDDDGNGYVDDVYGWNFLGNSKGENIDGTTMELTREYARLLKKQSDQGLTEPEQVYFNQISAEFLAKQTELQKRQRVYQKLMSAFRILKANGLKKETAEAVEAITSTDEEVLAAKELALIALKQVGDSAAVKDVLKDMEIDLLYGYNPHYDSSKIVGDNPELMSDIGYGNPDVIGPDAHHGTHVAGIIAAKRDNNIGIIGQADRVKIMAVRAVPNGDERDKDVANAIRYAVDNGANVINMSFGKPYSPQKSYVDEAVAYAESRGVILVHAAGNDGKNTESGANNFPNKKLFAGKLAQHEASNWIEVGASTKTKGDGLPAYFSNFGLTSVDLFAPGYGIVSTTPGNTYASFNGTSMASPEVAGVAAFLMARFPTKSALEIVDAMKTTTTQYTGLVVNMPNKGGASMKASFSLLSKAGGIVNADNALMKLLGTK